MSNRVGIEFKQICALLFAEGYVPEAGTVPPTRDTLLEGVKCEFKKNFLKLYAKNGMRMYVARQKVTRQIDLSGWGGATKGLVGVVPATKKNGQVEAHVDLSHDSSLAHISMLLLMMVSLPDPVVEKKAVPVTEAGKQRAQKAKEAKPDIKTGANVSKGDASAATQRLLFIWETAKKRSAQQGVEVTLVSEVTIEKLVAQGATMPADLEEAIAREKALRMAPVETISEPSEELSTDSMTEV